VGRGRVVGDEVDKDLLGVPVEQRAEVGVEVELDKGVLAVVGAGLVVWPAEDDIEMRDVERRGVERGWDDEGRCGDGGEERQEDGGGESSAGAGVS